MRTLRDTFRGQRREGADLRSAEYVGVVGRGLHRLRLRGGQVVTARGGLTTYAPGQKVTAGVHSGRTTSDYLLLSQPPAGQGGARAFVDQRDAADAAVVELSAAVPSSVAAGATEPVYVIGYGFVESPTTQLADYAMPASDPAAGVWVDDPLVSVGAAAWVDLSAPPAELVGKFVEGQTALLVNITLDPSTPAGHEINLRTV